MSLNNTFNVALWSPQRRLNRYTCTHSFQVSLSLLQAVKHRFIHDGFIFTHTQILLVCGALTVFDASEHRSGESSERAPPATDRKFTSGDCAPDVRSPFVNKTLSNEARRTSHGLNSSSQVVDGNPWWALQEQRGAQLSWS